MKIYVLLLTANFFNRHIRFWFTHLHREEKDTISLQGYIILVRAKDNMMVMIL